MADISFNDHRFRINQQPKVIVTSRRDNTVYGSDKELGDQIHKAIRRTRSKISNLEQQVQNKDKEVKRERAMRKAAERRDQDKASEGTYVDPYAGSTPSVNEELKDWLSPAAQRRRLLGKRNSPLGQKDGAPRQDRRRPRSHYPEDEAEGQENLTESYYSSDEERREMRHGRDKQGENEWDDRQATYPQRKYDPNAWYRDHGPPLPPSTYTMHNPWVSPHRVPPIPHYDPRLMHTIGPEYPLQAFSTQHSTSTPNQQEHRRRSLGDPHTSFTGPTLVIPAGSMEVGQGDHARGGTGAAPSRPSAPATPQHIPVTIEIKQSPDGGQHLRLPGQQQDSTVQSPGHSDSKLNTSQRSEAVSTGVGPSPPPQAMKLPFDERGLPLLLEELGACKDKNKELSEKFDEAGKEIEHLKMQLGVKDAMSEAEIAAKGAALIEEIYTAQKEHDEAILGRLKLANDERDDALSRLKKHQSKDGYDSGTDVYSNEDDNAPGDSSISNLLSRLTAADNRMAIDKYGSAIVGRISKTKGRRQQITTEEMRAILKEKEAAMTKCKKLEREVIELRKNRESLKSRNNSEKSLKAQLDITRDERDKALVAVKKLKDEIDSLKMYYNLHKSLSQEASLRDQFNNTLGSIETQVKSRDEVLARTQHNNSQLAAQVRQANDERNKLVAQLQRSEQDNQQLRQKNQQMERLVSVLRKKVAEGAVKTV